MATRVLRQVNHRIMYEVRHFSSLGSGAFPVGTMRTKLEKWKPSTKRGKVENQYFDFHKRIAKTV